LPGQIQGTQGTTGPSVEQSWEIIDAEGKPHLTENTEGTRGRACSSNMQGRYTEINP